MTHTSIIADVRKGQIKPLYFLHGAETYFIDAIADVIEEKALAEHERAFNQTILYGKDTDHLQVLDAARRLPMMAERQLVILREAQEMRSLSNLLAYAEKPVPTTVLVICYMHKSLNLNSKFGKALKANAVVFSAKKLYDNQVPDWISSYLKSKGLSAGPAASELLAEYLGTHLSKVANELDKLALNLPKGTEVTQQHIEDNIGISKDYNVFELQKALGLRDVMKANRIVNYFIANPKKNPIQVIIGSLYGYYSKLFKFHAVAREPEQTILSALGLRSSFFLREYRAAARNFPRSKTEAVIHLLAEYDLKSKGVGYNATGKPDGELLREMVWRILHC